VIDELGLRSRAAEMQKAFANTYLKSMEQMNNVHDDE